MTTFANNQIKYVLNGSFPIRTIGVKVWELRVATQKRLCNLVALAPATDCVAVNHSSGLIMFAQLTKSCAVDDCVAVI